MCEVLYKDTAIFELMFPFISGKMWLCFEKGMNS